jgi:ECF transporter S component (folate family)
LKKSRNNVTKKLVFSALAVAMSLVIGIVCKAYFTLTPVIRITFDTMPILLLGIMFGPVYSVMAAIGADVISALIAGYAPTPIITVGAAAIGLLGGLIPRLLPKAWPRLLRIALTVSAAHLIGSVVIKTFGLAQYYAMPFIVLMLWRLLNYAIISILECALLYLLGKNAAIARQLRAFSKNSSLL